MPYLHLLLLCGIDCLSRLPISDGQKLISLPHVAFGVARRQHITPAASEERNMERMNDVTPAQHEIAAAAAAAAVLVELPQPATAAASGQWAISA